MSGRPRLQQKQRPKFGTCQQKAQSDRMRRNPAKKDVHNKNASLEVVAKITQDIEE
jgi:hypothetical protein